MAAAADKLLVAWAALVTSSTSGTSLNRSDSNIDASSVAAVSEPPTPPAKKPRVEVATSKSTTSASAIVASATVAATSTTTTTTATLTSVMSKTVVVKSAPIKMTDPVRERAAQMLAEALIPPTDSTVDLTAATAAAASATPSTADAGDQDELVPAAIEGDASAIAMAIEAALFDKYKGDTSKDYKQQMRSLYSNLKNKKNPGLRRSLMVGDILPTNFVNMSVHDLADPALVEQRRKDAEWAKLVAMGPSQNVAAPTDAFQCSKCKQRYFSHIRITNTHLEIHI